MLYLIPNLTMATVQTTVWILLKSLVMNYIDRYDCSVTCKNMYVNGQPDWHTETIFHL